MNGICGGGREKDVGSVRSVLRKNAVITYSVAAGLEQAIDYITHIGFTPSDIEYLRSLRLFDETFLRYLEKFRFTGDVYAGARRHARFSRRAYHNRARAIARRSFWKRRF